MSITSLVFGPIEGLIGRSRVFGDLYLYPVFGLLGYILYLYICNDCRSGEGGAVESCDCGLDSIAADAKTAGESLAHKSAGGTLVHHHIGRLLRLSIVDDDRKCLQSDAALGGCLGSENAGPFVLRSAPRGGVSPSGETDTGRRGRAARSSAVEQVVVWVGAAAASHALLAAADCMSVV